MRRRPIRLRSPVSAPSRRVAVGAFPPWPRPPAPRPKARSPGSVPTGSPRTSRRRRRARRPGWSELQRASPNFTSGFEDGVHGSSSRSASGVEHSVAGLQAAAAVTRRPGQLVVEFRDVTTALRCDAPRGKAGFPNTVRNPYEMADVFGSEFRRIGLDGTTLYPRGLETRVRFRRLSRAAAHSSAQMHPRAAVASRGATRRPPERPPSRLV